MKFAIIKFEIMRLRLRRGLYFILEEPVMKRLQDIDFSVTPFVAIWEMTQACDLACRHCRAEAISHRDPGELMTREGFDLMDKIHSMKE